eukprot:3797236-Alexandrium_andersonii.AAC.1
MSASLVGSEMCIRDRCGRCAGAARALCGRCAGVVRALHGRCAGAVLAPVSYTHLTLPTICSV